MLQARCKTVTKVLRSPAFFVDDDGMYRLDETYRGVTAIKGVSATGDGWMLLPDGIMHLHAGFRWNGPDIVLDHPKLMIPSALHDAGCYGLASGAIPKENAKQVHFTYRDAMKTWRVPWIRRKVQFRAVRHGHGIYAKLSGLFKNS